MARNTNGGPTRRAVAFGLCTVPFLGAGPATASPPAPSGARLLVNQVGYRPDLPIRAIAALPPGGFEGHAELLEADDGQTVGKGRIGPFYTDRTTGLTLAAVDFDPPPMTGRFLLRVASVTSPPLLIAPEVYADPLQQVLRTFFLQRCGTAKADPITGLRHRPCHLDDAKLTTPHKGGPWSARGGWHTNGTYAKSTDRIAVAAAHLLYLLHERAELFADGNLTIPESGDGKPDLANEIQWGLEWLLGVQHTDGSVSSGVVGVPPPRPVLPHDDTTVRKAGDITASATAKTAAVLALAGRVLAAIDLENARRYVSAARLSWSYLLKIPEAWRPSSYGSGLPEGYPRRGTGALDDLLWAAGELYLATGKRHYYERFGHLAGLAPVLPVHWSNPSFFGLAAFATSRAADPSGLRPALEQRILSAADRLADTSRTQNFHAARPLFVEGSNGLNAAAGLLLMTAHKMTGRLIYLETAADQLHMLLGRNPVGKSFVTGLGLVSVSDLSHYPSIASRRILPGFMAGGPNTFARDGHAHPGRGPLSYSDNRRSTDTNQPAIDGTAALAGLLGRLAVRA